MLSGQAGRVHFEIIENHSVTKQVTETSFARTALKNMAVGLRKKASSVPTRHSMGCTLCERDGIVGGDEGPIGGVAQVIGCHGVKVGVGVHGEEGQEEDGEVQGEVKGDVEESQGRRHMDGMRMEWQTLNGLEPCGV